MMGNICKPQVSIMEERKELNKKVEIEQQRKNEKDKQENNYVQKQESIKDDHKLYPTHLEGQIMRNENNQEGSNEQKKKLQEIKSENKKQEQVIGTNL
ncbi:unnamed protein product [Paramecium sonneborni]|uniref:Uncharacterized protein n=1 Tax=Paramecium sonneborni TaxID=65129 RepID=A0A8S1RLG7_9CILI|nr:unnamed protein product [Paramecium sonneborni]